MATGWTWDDVDRLTLPRYEALTRYWRKWPPVHILVGAYFGMGKDTPKPEVQSESDFAGFFANMTGELPPGFDQIGAAGDAAPPPV